MDSTKSKIQQAREAIIQKAQIKEQRQMAYRCAVIAAAIGFAVDNGYEESPFDTSNDSFDEAFEKAQAFLIAYKPRTSEECDIYSSSQGQHVSWSDGKYFDYRCDGEIVNFADHWHKPVGTKVIFDTLVDSEGEVIDLYFTVVPSVHNTPIGYIYDWKTHKHIVHAAEDFDYEIFKMNEANNDHTENAVQIVHLFGTPEEKEEIYTISAHHTFHGHLKKYLQDRRDVLVATYIDQVKNYPHE
jgi:hypothetical protein